MRLITFADGTGTRAAVIHGEGACVALPFPTVLELILAGPAGLEAARAALAGGPRLALDGLRLLAPIPFPRRNVFCLGWNYAEHRRESAAARGGPGAAEAKLPDRPIFFTKATTSVAGPGQPIPLHPSVTSQMDWEVELGVVLAQGGADIPEGEALGRVFGYTVINDVSARDVQVAHGKQFFKGKSLDGTCPMGPWIVTADEIPDPQALRIACRVNGVEKQAGHTSDMIFGVATTLDWLSRGMTLLPGDIIATGTPSGVGFARNPPEFLKAGDLVQCEVEGIGVLENRVG